MQPRSRFKPSVRTKCPGQYRIRRKKHYPAQCLIRCDTVFLQRIQPLIYQNIPIRTPRHIRQHPTIPRRLQQTGIIRSQRSSSRCRNHEPIFRHRPARKKGLVEKGWQQALPDHAAPYTSTMVFLVRKNNPKQIRDWNDLAKDGANIVIAKTSGNGRYAFLGAYGYGLKANNGNEQEAQKLVASILKNTPVFENGGRAAATTFTQRNIGDVLITFENEANYVSKKLTQGQFEIVYPSYTISAESPVAVVNSVVAKKGTQKTARAYLEYLWSEPAQELAASLYLRPRNPEVLARHKADFPDLDTFPPEEKFGGWDNIMKTYFADGGVFDRLTAQK
ncbi:sulfate ABC transporter substrate-binding protein [Neisseria gonorrhoeae]